MEEKRRKYYVEQAQLQFSKADDLARAAQEAFPRIPFAVGLAEFTNVEVAKRAEIDQWIGKHDEAPEPPDDGGAGDGDGGGNGPTPVDPT